MGAVLGVKIDFSGPRADKPEDDDIDNRRRNSLAFYITQFVQYEEDEYGKLIEAVKADKFSKTNGKPPVFRPSSKLLINPLICVYSNIQSSVR